MGVVTPGAAAGNLGMWGSLGRGERLWLWMEPAWWRVPVKPRGGGCIPRGCPPPRSDFAQRMAQALSRHPDSVLHTINLAGNQLEDRGT